MGLNIKKEKTANVSNYKPTDKELEVTKMVLRDYETGHQLLNKPWEEYNFRSIIEEINVNRKSFNGYVPPRSQDPDHSWRAQTIRPIVRAKLISIAAHVTSEIIIPAIFAQNRDSEEDKEAAKILGDLLEWAIENSNYSRQFITAVVTALVDPIVYVHQDFRNVMRKVKMMKEDGTYEMKEIVDEVLSGFCTNVLSSQDVYFSNMFEPNIQKQRFLLHRKVIDYSDAQTIYGKHKNFSHVKKGYQTLWIESENSFYEQRDETMKDSEVELITYYNRLEDLELVFISGVLVCEPDKPLRRNDKLYPITKTGYEPINNGNFFMYKSAANKIGYDEDLINTLYNYVMDGTFLALMPPMALYGDEDVNGPSVIVPGAVTPLDRETRLEAIGPRADLRAGFEAIQMAERSLTESTQSASRQGIADSKQQTAHEVLTLEQNAKTTLGLFGKMIGFLVEDLGKLILGDVIQYITLPEVSQITSVSDPLKYRTILVPNRVEGGKSKTRKIKFTDELLGSENMSQEELMNKSLDLLSEEGLDSNVSIALVNPQLIRQIKYKVFVSPEKMQTRSKALDKALDLELYDRAIGNPMVDIEAVTRDFLFESYKPGTSDKYIKKKQDNPNPVGMENVNDLGTIDTPKGVTSNLTGQMTGSNSLRNVQSLG